MMKKILFLLLSLMSLPIWAGETAEWFRNSAISPDGQTIVFSYKGDIFTVPTSGGASTRLTSNAAYDGYPCWSPDGKQIAFSSDRYGSLDVFVISAQGGMPKRLTTNSANEAVQTFLDNGHILYTAFYMPTAKDIIFPGNYSQVYSVDLQGHRPQLFSAIAMEAISINKQGEMLYHNYKGYEDEWRKHHHSPITRDLFLSQISRKNRTYRQLTTDNVENRNAVWTPDGKGYYFLSEKSGTMNIYKENSIGSTPEQITNYRDHPVRYLSIATNGTLCFSYDGSLYTLRPGSKPEKVNIHIVMDDTEDFNQPQIVSSGATAFDISNDEKEIAFTLNGDLYTTMTDYATTKRLTTTPEEETQPNISPDGRTIVYSSERNGTWSIFAMKLQNKADKQFTYATDIKEEALITGKEPFTLPKFSPDGKKIAFLANRTEIRIYDVKTKTINVALPSKFNFSYSDGDINFEWSPDSRWILTSYMGENGWNNMDVAVVSVDGKKVTDLTNSGYSDESPQWALGGKAIIWASDRAGFRSHGSWGAEDDVYIMFLDREAYELSNLNKEDRTLYQERLNAKNDSTENKKKGSTQAKAKKKQGKNKHDSHESPKDSAEIQTDTIKPLNLDFNNCEDRVKRLTINSSNLGGMYLTPDGKKLYYIASFEDGFDLWVHDLEDNSTKIICKGLGGGQFIPDKKGEALYMCNGSLRKITLADGTVKDLPFKAEKEGQTEARREYIFDHCVNQVLARFCETNYHGVDFKSLAAHYHRFLPNIGNSRELSEMFSELLGELNCSHTGLKYRAATTCPSTAQLGAFFDPDYEGDGLLIQEVVSNGPLDLPNSKIKAGCIIHEINHQKILKDADYFPLLSGKEGQWVLLTLTDEKGKTFETHVKPISTGSLNQLLYKRWVRRAEKFTEDYSKGKVGYVHIEDMDSKSFRTIYSEILGKFRNCQSLVVDERHNGGGWLHDDLAVLLSGKQFQVYTSRGQKLGVDPFNRWNRPSCVMVCEDCYSNANGFPSMYKALKLGKLVGMPMAGTMTAVWWERQEDPSLILGLPEVNCLDMNGQPLENKQLDPDVEVNNTPSQMLSGEDEQLRRAIDLMMQNN